MKYVLIYTLFLMSVFHTSCEQNQPEVKKNIIKSEPKDTVNSYEPHLIFRKIYTPHLMVHSIKQDRNGNILIAGSNLNSSVLGGVFRYDGKSFTNLTSKLGLHRFWDVLEDRRGNLWFASLDSGVYYYNGKSLPTGQAGFQHFTTREGLANNAVKCIYEDKAGIIWFGTEGGVSRYDGKSFRNFTTKEGLSNNDLTTIMEDKTGKLWFGTKGEACFYDGKTFTVLKNKDGIPFNNVGSIIEDKKGNIWFGVNGGRANSLWRYDGSVFTKVSQRVAYAVIEDKKGNIWTTGDGALSRYDAKTLYNKKPTVTEIIAEPPLLGLLEANDGSIWFGGLTFMGVWREHGR
jgi:ligand-binding sensor domain-containing protein